MSNQVEKHTNGLELGFFRRWNYKSTYLYNSHSYKSAADRSSSIYIGSNIRSRGSDPVYSFPAICRRFLQSKKATFDLRIEVVRAGGSRRIQTGVERRDGEPRTHETGLETWARRSPPLWSRTTELMDDSACQRDTMVSSCARLARERRPFGENGACMLYYLRGGIDT